MSPDNTELRFSQLFTPDEIIGGLSSTSREGCIRELVELLIEKRPDLDRDAIISAVIARENVMPTTIMPGLAIPHTRLEEIEYVLVAVGTSRTGVDFGAANGEPVHVIILVLAPKSDPAIYLQVLATLAKCFTDPATPRRVAACNTPEKIWNYFFCGTDILPEYLTARDMMNTDPVVLEETDTLETAIDVFCRSGLLDLPVVDEVNDLVGIVTEESLMRLNLPEHVLWMEDLRPILHFEPFAEMLKKDTGIKVADIMSDDYSVVAEDVPAIQVAKIITRRDVRAVMVTRGRRLVGIIGTRDFIAKLLWA